MKVYLAGPMTGYPLYNFPVFDAYRNFLLLRGYEVVSPADLDREHGFDPEKTGDANLPSRTDCAKRDIEALCECEAIFLMPGHQNSKGCKMERAAAEFLGLVVHELVPLSEARLNPAWVYAAYNVS